MKHVHIHSGIVTVINIDVVLHDQFHGDDVTHLNTFLLTTLIEILGLT